MSALALVTGRLAPGVWRSDRLRRSELAQLAVGLGWTVRSGAITATADKSAFLQQLGEIAEVPAYVRPNWDSMADGLRDTDLTSPCLLLIEPDEPTAFDSIAIEVLNEACTFWHRHEVTMQVVWFGPVDAPDLDAVDPERRSRMELRSRM